MAGLLWVPVTLAAAVFQVSRTALQKRLKDRLDDVTVTWARYIYSLPLVWVYAWLVAGDAMETHAVTGRLLWLCLAGGIAQILGTVLLVGMFSHRNFAVGTTFAKTEGVQIAVLGAFLVSVPVGLVGWAGILAGAAGVILMAIAHAGMRARELAASLGSRAAWMGMLSGTCFAFTALAIRNGHELLDASDGVAGDLGSFAGSAVVLCAMVTMQSVLLGAWLLWRRGPMVARMFRAGWLPPAIGLTGFAGSALWFAAFTMAHPAYVKTLANIELPLAVLVGSRFFGERHNRKEHAGMALTFLGVTLLLWA